MTLAATVTFLASLLVAPGVAAQTPETSERFREAMSACVLPGPGLDPRTRRLEDVGWQLAEPSPEIMAIYAGALAMTEPPDTLTTEAWQAAIDRARGLAMAAPPRDIYTYAGSLIAVELQSGTDAPTCFLATYNSRESDLLFADLAKFGAVRDWGFGRRGEMSTTQFDASGQAWRTEISLTSADAKSVNPLLPAPLRVTLTATFVTQPKEVTQ